MKRFKNYNTFLKKYKNLKVLITGSTGFKGAWLSFWLFLLGAKVVGIGLKPEKNSIIFKSLKLNKKIKQYYIDIRDFKSLDKVIKREKPTIVFHLAAQSIVSQSFKNPLETVTTNVIGSTNVLETVRLNKVPNLIYVTSDKCYLNLDKLASYKENDTLGGLDNYSSSKASAEIIFYSYYDSYFKNKHLNIASVRAGNVIGGGDLKKDRIIPDIIKSIKINKNLILRNPNSTRPWQHVLEPLSGYLLLGNLLMSKKLDNKIKPSWNFGPYKKNCKKVNEIIKKILKKIKTNIKVIIKKNKNFHESNLLSLSINKASKELGWKPTLNFENTIDFTASWYKAYLNGENLEKMTANQIKFYTSKMKIKK